MTIINRIEYNDHSWKKDIAKALKQGSNVTLKNFRRDFDMSDCQEIGDKHKARVTLHLDQTVCCFKISNKGNR